MQSIHLRLILIFSLLFLHGCSKSKVINGVHYDTYGFINEGAKKNPDIEYELVIGNVLLGVILIETLIGSIYFIGFDIYQPIGPIDEEKVIGEIK